MSLPRSRTDCSGGGVNPRRSDTICPDDRFFPLRSETITEAAANQVEPFTTPTKTNTLKGFVLESQQNLTFPKFFDVPLIL